MVPLTILLSLTGKGLRLLRWRLSDVLQHQPIKDAVQLNALATFRPEHLVLGKKGLNLWRLLKELLKGCRVVRALHLRQHGVNLVEALFDRHLHFAEPFLHVDEALFQPR